MLPQPAFSPNFPLEVLTFSNTAQRRGFDNSLPAEFYHRGSEMSWILDELQTAIHAQWPGSRLMVTSGYRCQMLNRALGSDDTSAHTKMLAVDLKVPGIAPTALAAFLTHHLDEFDQLIREYTWVHLGLAALPNAGRRQLLCAVRRADGTTGYREGLA